MLFAYNYSSTYVLILVYQTWIDCCTNRAEETLFICPSGTARNGKATSPLGAILGCPLRRQFCIFLLFPAQSVTIFPWLFVVLFYQCNGAKPSSIIVMLIDLVAFTAKHELLSSKSFWRKHHSVGYRSFKVQWGPRRRNSRPEQTA